MSSKYILVGFFLALGLGAYAQSNVLWYVQPAQKWTEALPIGNGRLGGMVFGGVEEEHIKFNESTLWSGRPRAFAREDAASYLGTIRQLLAEGKQAEAEQLAEQHFMGKKDPNEATYNGLKEAWYKKVRQDTSFARVDWDDKGWKEMEVPTPDGWEAASEVKGAGDGKAVSMQGIDGAVWFRVAFDLPASWEGKDVVFQLGRIRDIDFTYVNGVRVGMGEGISKKREYRVKASLLKAHNVMAIQVINFDDKGGLTGLKGKDDLLAHWADGAGQAIALPKKWKYFVQDADAPILPKYEADYQPFGDLYLKLAGVRTIEEYRRELNIENAIGKVSFKGGDVHYTREYFASALQGVLVSHIKTDQTGAVNVEASLGTVHRLFHVRKVDDRTLGLSLKVRNGVLKGESFLRVVAENGKVEVREDKILVRGADAVTFYLAAATSYGGVDPAAQCQAVMNGLKGKSYASIKAAHEREFEKYFDRFYINFGSSISDSLPTDERIRNYSAAKDPALLAVYMQYARYLLISSSRPASPMPANLQGIWNDLLSPPWGSKYTTNINLEMNYWPSEVLNLSDCSKPLFRLIGDLAVAGQQTAKKNYNASGWVLHHNTDLWRGTAPINASNHGIWVTGGAWLCHQIWEHYCYTHDAAFLRQYYPVMKAAAGFFIDFLVKDPHHGWLISTPSNSPEHGGLVAGPTMDHQIIRDLFKNCIDAERVLNLYPEFSILLKEKYRQIAPNQIGKYGQLQEWLEDKDDTADTHRHISHLWGVYPGTDITWKDSALMKAARQSMLYRGDEGTGWSLAWKVNCWARFRDGDHALRLVDKLLSDAAGATGGERGGVYPNLFDAHPPFQIDGNFGGAAGIAELLVQSQDSVIEILPALPAALPLGEVKGICARGGFELDLRWDRGVLQEVTVRSKAGGDGVFKYKDKLVKLHTKKGEVYRFDGSLVTVVAGVRSDVLLDAGWLSRFEGGEWVKVNVPHNWDTYGGYRRLRHGDLHGSAIYRKSFWVDSLRKDRRSFLFFEGVGSYATVWVNGKKVGYHAGGRTSFTLDVTDALLPGGENFLEVRADHPAFIRDLPWVCGACSDDRGFSEGSQPLGIFRPVHLITTAVTRIEPFGVHVWNDTSLSKIWVETEVKSYAGKAIEWSVRQTLRDREGKLVAGGEAWMARSAGQGVTSRQQLGITKPHLWSVEEPYLYTLTTEVVVGGKVVDRVETSYGIRRIQWTEHGFLLNGKPVFINGIAEYEHQIGGSHAFSDEEIEARVRQISGAGFNAFRDAHQPHNLLYQHYWDSLGILWWPQLSAHVWYESPEFRRNFKANLVEWVKERRNSPSIILWGLQNESKLPEDFARECTELIRQLDPTAVDQRRVTTCNGGKGTDWDVPQNWTGTYGGDPATYGADLKRQVLVGEYGGWRSIDLHGDVQYSEDRLSGLMEQKIRLADSVKDQVAGHFAWLFNSHDNPGRVQSGEGRRPLDQIGPVNYKGLLTSWGEPTDLYYLYRSNYVKTPMVYIVSHTWADRPKKGGIAVYSNCEEVELFNDMGERSLGRRKRGGVGTHFQWDSVELNYNVLYAVGYVGGKEVAVDRVVLDHLEKAPHFDKLYNGGEVLAAASGYNYLYRVNCGGLDYVDHQGNKWLADRHLTGSGVWGSRSWTDDYDSLPAFFASQRKTGDPIGGTADWPLFQDFRYGREKLGYSLPVQDGDYRLELYFVEPWWGRGGGLDARGMRSFDVAVNGVTVIRDLDIFTEAGYSTVLKKVVEVHVTDGVLNISFPWVAVGQAVISALAVASLDTRAKPAPGAAELFSEEIPRGTKLEPAYDSRPVTAYKTAAAGRLSGDTTEWEMSVNVGDLYSLTIKYRYLPAVVGAGKLEVRLLDGTLIKQEEVRLLTTLPNKWSYITTSTGTMINAGRYKVRLITKGGEGFKVDELQVQ